jgi:hypothetical protein
MEHADNPNTQARAREVGNLIRLEDGVGEAVRLIEQLVIDPYHPK